MPRAICWSLSARYTCTVVSSQKQCHQTDKSTLLQTRPRGVVVNHVREKAAAGLRKSCHDAGFCEEVRKKGANPSWNDKANHCPEKKHHPNFTVQKKSPSIQLIDISVPAKSISIYMTSFLLAVPHQRPPQRVARVL
jgi:hypothetical protein